MAGILMVSGSVRVGSDNAAVIATAALTELPAGSLLEYTDCRIVEDACVDVPVPRALLADDGLVAPGPERDAIEPAVAALAVAV